MRDGKIFVATREQPSGVFAASHMVDNLSSYQNDPFVVAAGIYLAVVVAPGDEDIQFSQYTDSGAFTAPVTVGGVNAIGAIDGRPVLPADGRTMLFTSNRAEGGQGGLDVWSATRPTATGAFGDLRNVIELNRGDTDAPDWVSPDGCVLYMESTRPGGFGKADLYIARRQR